MTRAGAVVAATAALALGLSACSVVTPSPGPGWVYQLQGYPDGRLDELARAPQQLAVIDLARDARSDFFHPGEIAALQAAGKQVLAYMEIGSIESFRPEYPTVIERGLVLNSWPDWPDEFFVRYWEESWWALVVRRRLDRAITGGFDGVYLDTPLAYEELDLQLVPGADRAWLAQQMVNLIVRVSAYAKAQRPGFLIVPQNSPELRHFAGYLDAIDGIGVEELFVRATDAPCTAAYCGENLDETRAVRDAGKFVLAVDYATRPDQIAAACARYRQEGFIGYVAVRDLDRAGPPCPAAARPD